MEAMDLDHGCPDKAASPFVDKKSSSFVDRSKNFKRDTHSTRPGSSARDKMFNQRRFGSQRSEFSPTSYLNEGLNSLNLCSPQGPDGNRSFGFSDYSEFRSPVRSHSSPPGQDASPMEVDSCSPEMTETKESFFTTARLWSAGMTFGLTSPRKSDEVAPNPYSVAGDRVGIHEGEGLVGLDQVQISQTPTPTPVLDFVDLCQDDDASEEEEMVLRTTFKQEKDDFPSEGFSKSVKTRSPGSVKGLQISPPSPKQEKCRFLKFICYLLVIVLCFIVAALGLSFVAETYRARTCVSNQRLNLTAIQSSLRQQVYGQHIAYDMVSKALEDLMEVQRTMVLSFHGWTGIGKTFVSSIITNHVFTPSVHRIIIPLHFPHIDEDKIYQKRIHEWIITNVTSCAVNVFIIDEMDKASEGVILGLAKVLKDIRNLELNNSRILVVLISNTGGGAINRFSFRHLENGNDRHKLLASGLEAGILSDEDTEWLQVLHSAGVIDHIVPFLPLERKHVKLCVDAYLETYKEYNLAHVNVEKILDDFVYLPKNNPIFSKSGCRQVNSKVDLAVDIDGWEFRDEL